MAEGNRRIGAEVFVTAQQAKSELQSVKQEIADVGTTAQKSSSNASVAMNGLSDSTTSQAAAFGTLNRSAAGAAQQVDNVKTGSKSAETAMNGLANSVASTGESVASLSAKKAQLLGQLTNVEKSLRSETRVLADAQAAAEKFGGSQKALNNELTASQQKVAALVQQQTALKNELSTVSAAIKTTGAATASNTQEVVQSKVAHTEVAGATEKAREGFNKLTTMVNTGGGVLQGYDAIITAVIRSMGGITLGTAIFIQMANVLIPVLLSLASAKQDQINLDKEMAETNAFLSLSQGGGETVAALTAQKLATADLTTAISAVADRQQSLTNLTKKRTEAQQELTNLMGYSNDAERQYRNTIIAVADQKEGWRRKVVASTNALTDERKEIEAHLDTLNTLRRIYGLTEEQVIAFGRSIGINEGALEGLRSEMSRNVETLKKFAGELEAMPARMVNVEQAALGLQLSLQSIQMPRIDTDVLRGIQGAEGRVNDGLRILEATGVGDRAVQARALAQELKALREEMLRQVAAGQNMVDVTRSLLIPTRELLAESDKQDAAYRKLTASAKSHEAAEKALAATTANLALEMQRAQVQAASTGFEQRRALAKLEFESRKTELERNNQLTSINLDRLRFLYIHNLNEITKEELKATRAQERDRVIAFERQREERVKMQDRELADLRSHLARQRQVREEDQRRVLEDLAKVQFNTRSNRPGREDAQAEAYRKQAEELRRVEVAFGRVARSERIFAIQLRALEKISNGDILGGLRDSITALDASFIESGTFADIWAGAIVGAFDAVFNQGANFLSAFGKMLIAGLLKVYGEAAIASGTYHIAEGIARMATLWDFAGGAKEFAAGTALVALGGAMVGAAGLISNSISKQAASGSPATAGGGASTGTTGGGRRNAPGPQRVEFPTSGSFSSGSQPIVVRETYRLDAGETKRYWDEVYKGHMRKNGVLSRKSVAGKDNKILKKNVA